MPKSTLAEGGVNVARITIVSPSSRGIVEFAPMMVSAGTSKLKVPVALAPEVKSDAPSVAVAAVEQQQTSAAT